LFYFFFYKVVFLFFNIFSVSFSFSLYIFTSKILLIGILIILTVLNSLLIFFSQFDCKLIQLFFLIYITRVVNNHIIFDVKFAHTHRQIIIFESFLQILFELILHIRINFMFKQILPLNPLLGINDQHFPNDILTDLRNIIDLPIELKLFILDIFEQINHISCREGRLSKQQLIEHSAY
jgi:hypothetical protein